MFTIWRKWTINFHPFTNVKLTEAESATLSEGVRAFAEVDEDTGNIILPTLKYSFPPPPPRLRGMMRRAAPKLSKSNATAEDLDFVERALTSGAEASTSFSARNQRFRPTPLWGGTTRFRRRSLDARQERIRVVQGRAEYSGGTRLGA